MMDEQQRRERIKRMKRAKEKQLRRRRLQIMLLKRCGVIAVVVAVALLLISGIWSRVKPSGEDSSTRSAQTQTEDAAQGNEEDEVQSDEVTPTPTEEVAEDENSEEEAESGETVEEESEAAPENGTEAEAAQISAQTNLEFSVPGWQVDNNGWWYATANNTYYHDGWKVLDGQEYYFNTAGYMQTGWTSIDGKSCYFSEAGIYDPEKESKMVALTFDDGPENYTAQLLDTLEQYGAKATFFMLGENVEAYGSDLIPRMQALGCELGNHSYSHPNLKDLSEEDVRSQYDRTDAAIAEITGGEVATVARTPYGSQDAEITNIIGKPCIYWSLDTLDWETKDVNSNISMVMDYVSDGEIILMHDIWPTTVESIATIVPSLIDEGYQLVTVSELAQAKGVDMEDGVTYYDFYSAEEATAGGEG